MIAAVDQILPRPVAYLTGLLLVAGLAAMIWAAFRTPGGEEVLPEATPLIVIDAGHGGTDGGTTIYGILEKDVVLDIATKVEDALLARGVKVVMTRRTDVGMSLAERAAVARQFPGALFVSLHVNRFQSPRVRGAETYYTTPIVPTMLRLEPGDKGRPYRDERSKELADRILAEIEQRVGMPVRGSRPSQLYVTKEIPAPSVLVECGYLSNPHDARLLSRAEGRKNIAMAVAAACDRFLRDSRDNRLLGCSPWSGPVVAAEPPVEGPEQEP